MTMTIDILGVEDMRRDFFPAGIDVEAMLRQRTPGGMLYGDAYNQLANTLFQFNNAAVSTHDWLPWLCWPTTEDSTQYGEGGAAEFVNTTEYTKPPAVRGSEKGHMYPMDDKNLMLAWTNEYMETKMTPSRLANDITKITGAAGNLLEIRALEGFFADSDRQVATTGVSPGLIGATSTLVWTPPTYNGKNFLSTHNHQLRYTVAQVSTACAAATFHMKEHGHMPPYDAFVNETDVSTVWAPINDDTERVYFRPLSNVGLSYATDQTRSTQTVNESKYVGVVETPSGVMNLIATPRLETNYFGIFKPYGLNNMLNSVAWRYDTRFGLGIIARSAMFDANPTQGIVTRGQNGFAIGQTRTQGVVVRLAASGVYIEPTIT